MTKFGIAGALFFIVLTPLYADDRPDLLLADFEANTYGEWHAAGAAFGPGPAAGTLPGQMPVEGFEGKRLVNSFHGGDAATGTLTSPVFEIQRDYLNFLIGGGKHPGETCVNLLIDGNIVRTASGPNSQPGGSERLEWHTWDIAEFAGKSASIQIVDQYAGGWGHINVDQILQSGRRRQAEPASRELAIEARFLHLPIKNGAPKRRMKFIVNGQTKREFEIELADGEPDFHVFADVSDFQGTTLAITVDSLPADSRALDAITASDQHPAAEELYSETLRPQFHFTSRRGWLNDPNGLVYADGQWHLFYQHNPYGVQWGNMHWGHATSPDLMHWNERPIALYPHAFGDWAFSGSAVVDHENTSGFGTGEKPPLVLAYTSTGRGECIAFSNDRGQTWTEYQNNPVVRHQGRDPKLIWHEPTKRWVMAVYQEKKDGDTAAGRFIAFYSSPDLKNWTFESRIEGYFECPDIFQLPIQGAEGRSRWVLYAADGEYSLGEFDGRTFHADSGKHRLWHGRFYAAQTYDSAPEGRRVQIGWGREITFPGMPFNQQMTIPVELTLRETPDGIRMFANAVSEVESLWSSTTEFRDVAIDKAGHEFQGWNSALLDARIHVDLREASQLKITLAGIVLDYDALAGQLRCGNETLPLESIDGGLQLRLLLDRRSLEIFGNDGRLAASILVSPDPESKTMRLQTDAPAVLEELVVHDMNSIWKD